MASTLFVGNVPSSASNSEVVKLFSQWGNVVNVDLHTPVTGFVYVTFDSTDAVHRCLQAYAQREIILRDRSLFLEVKTDVMESKANPGYQPEAVDASPQSESKRDHSSVWDAPTASLFATHQQSLPHNADPSSRDELLDVSLTSPLSVDSKQLPALFRSTAGSSHATPDGALAERSSNIMAAPVPAAGGNGWMRQAVNGAAACGHGGISKALSNAQYTNSTAPFGAKGTAEVLPPATQVPGAFSMMSAASMESVRGSTAGADGADENHLSHAQFYEAMERAAGRIQHETQCMKEGMGGYGGVSGHAGRPPVPTVGRVGRGRAGAQAGSRASTSRAPSTSRPSSVAGERGGSRSRDSSVMGTAASRVCSSAGQSSVPIGGAAWIEKRLAESTVCLDGPSKHVVLTCMRAVLDSPDINNAGEFRNRLGMNRETMRRAIELLSSDESDWGRYNVLTLEYAAMNNAMLEVRNGTITEWRRWMGRVSRRAVDGVYAAIGGAGEVVDRTADGRPMHLRTEARRAGHNAAVCAVR